MQPWQAGEIKRHQTLYFDSLQLSEMYWLFSTSHLFTVSPYSWSNIPTSNFLTDIQKKVEWFRLKIVSSIFFFYNRLSHFKNVFLLFTCQWQHQQQRPISLIFLKINLPLSLIIFFCIVTTSIIYTVCAWIYTNLKYIL